MESVYVIRVKTMASHGFLFFTNSAAGIGEAPIRSFAGDYDLCTSE